jgi:hypothetical protein
MEEPTRTWCFRTLNLALEVGEHRPDEGQAVWGLDMLAIGRHSQEATVQTYLPGRWARPAWATPTAGAEAGRPPLSLDTDRAIAMEGDVPLLPGSSLRGPLRHALSRWRRVQGESVRDPHLCNGEVGKEDPAGKLFGTVSDSSQLLIRDGHVVGDWFAARMHMHAEDELSAGSYGNAKRDAVRLLRGRFEMLLVMEGPCPQDISNKTRELDQLVSLGALGHLPIGGHKTHGAGSIRWKTSGWSCKDVQARNVAPPRSPRTKERRVLPSPLPDCDGLKKRGLMKEGAAAHQPVRRQRRVVVTAGDLGEIAADIGLTLAEAARRAREELGDALVCWWCEPRIDLGVPCSPATFGWSWESAKSAEGEKLRVDEVVFLMETASWRAARTVRAGGGYRAVVLRGVEDFVRLADDALVREVPARLHANRKRFSAPLAPLAEEGVLTLREWCVEDEVIGYTARRGVE